MSPAFSAPAVLASRLSALFAHDMAGALQGLKAALALLDDSSDAALQAEARALAQQSAAELEARLGFFRAAFAGRGIEGTADFERLCLLPFAGRRASLRWVALDTEAPGPLRQAALNFAHLAATALISGGEATMWLDRAGGSWRTRLEAVGPRLRVDAEALSGLRRQEPTSGAPGRWAAGAFVCLSISEAGGVLDVELGETCLTLEARLPDSGG